MLGKDSIVKLIALIGVQEVPCLTTHILLFPRWLEIFIDNFWSDVMRLGWDTVTLRIASQNAWLSADISVNLVWTDFVVHLPYVSSAAMAGANEVHFWNKVALKCDTVWSIPNIGSSVACTHAHARCCSSISFHPQPRFILLRWNISRETSALFLGYVGRRELKVWQKRLGSKDWYKHWCSATIIVTWSTAERWQVTNYHQMQCWLKCYTLSHIW